MGLKIICDDCKKELTYASGYYDLSHRGPKAGSFNYCAICFKKHWKGKLPQRKF